jgi:hypothetical protein
MSGAPADNSQFLQAPMNVSFSGGALLEWFHILNTDRLPPFLTAHFE